MESVGHSRYDVDRYRVIENIVIIAHIQHYTTRTGCGQSGQGQVTSVDTVLFARLEQESVRSEADGRVTMNRAGDLPSGAVGHPRFKSL